MMMRPVFPTLIPHTLNSPRKGVLPAFAADWGAAESYEDMQNWITLILGSNAANGRMPIHTGETKTLSPTQCKLIRNLFPHPSGLFLDTFLSHMAWIDDIPTQNHLTQCALDKLDCDDIRLRLPPCYQYLKDPHHLAKIALAHLAFIEQNKDKLNARAMWAHEKIAAEVHRIPTEPEQSQILDSLFQEHPMWEGVKRALVAAIPKIKNPEWQHNLINRFKNDYNTTVKSLAIAAESELKRLKPTQQKATL
jgi:hypothetical protein